MTQIFWSKLSNKVVLIFGLLSISTFQAQSTFETYKSQYPDYNELIVNNSTSYSIKVIDKKLKVIQDNQFESMILSEYGIQNNKEYFSYSELVQLVSFDAYTIVQDRGREKKIKVTQALEKKSSNNSVFHDDLKTKQLVFPNLEAGAKKVYNYTTEFIDPNLMHKYIFGDSNSVKNSTLEIKTDKNISIGYEVFNDPNNLINFSKSENKNTITYQWTLLDSKPMKFENNSPDILYTIPHIIFYIKEYTVDKSTVDVLGNIDRMYTYFCGFVKNLNKTEDDNLKNLTLSITENKATDEEKLKAIYYWVKDNVKYIAFENGYEGFIPREASLVYERKFGDCKDMASIITSMANYANIPNVYLAWIGTRRIPYSFSTIATPSTTDHMIAVYQKEGENIFLDATDQETRYGLPSAFIQDKEALLYKGDTPIIVKVPITNASKNLIKDDVVFTIKNDKIIGSGQIDVLGYNRTNILGQIGDANNKIRSDMIKGLVLKGNNKFNLIDFKEENIKEREKPYIVKYNFDIENYMVTVDKEIYINLFFDKYFENSTLEKDRETSYDFDYLMAYSSTIEFQIPTNYKVTYVPENHTIDNDVMKVNIKYQQKGNSIILISELSVKKIIIDKKDFSTWNQTIKQLKSIYSETIGLEQK